MWIETKIYLIKINDYSIPTSVNLIIDLVSVSFFFQIILTLIKIDYYMDINQKVMRTSLSKHFVLSDFLAKNEVFHIARVTISSKHDLSYHSHNYAELLWIENGEGVHHINRYNIPVKKNELIMIRPVDKHTFSTKGNPMTLVNIAFSKKSLAYFKERYFFNLNTYFWVKTVLPFHITISENLIKRLSSRANETMKFQRSNLQLDSLLLFIFRNISINESGIPHSNAPLWLLNAINKYNGADYFKEGMTSFVRLCDRNPDYVNRVVKEVFNKTLTEFVNDIRIKYATNQLILTNLPIKTISDFCGFTSLAYFYKQFKFRLGLTPLKYREIHQTMT